LSIVALQGQSLAFHVHAIGDHERGGHRHAPAIHHHDDHDQHGEVPHVDSPDSSGGSITLTIPAAAAPVSADHLFVEMHAALLLPELPPSDRTRVVDMRSHGPPVRPAESLRAPPQFLPV
jgi:hypothetical protein